MSVLAGIDQSDDTQLKTYRNIILGLYKKKFSIGQIVSYLSKLDLIDGDQASFSLSDLANFYGTYDGISLRQDYDDTYYLILEKHLDLGYLFQEIEGESAGIAQPQIKEGDPGTLAPESFLIRPKIYPYKTGYFRNIREAEEKYFSIVEAAKIAIPSGISDLSLIRICRLCLTGRAIDSVAPNDMPEPALLYKPSQKPEFFSSADDNSLMEMLACERYRIYDISDLERSIGDMCTHLAKYLRGLAKDAKLETVYNDSNIKSFYGIYHDSDNSEGLGAEALLRKRYFCEKILYPAIYGSAPASSTSDYDSLAAQFDLARGAIFSADGLYGKLKSDKAFA
jgi:hypothetical protein